MTDIEIARLIFGIGILAAIGAIYYAYTIWRDERLDTEEERRDHTHGGEHS